jgi:hypothetical protein
MSEFVQNIRFIAAGQDDPQSVALSECADRIEALEKALEKVAQHDLQAIALDALRPGGRIALKEESHEQ